MSEEIETQNIYQRAMATSSQAGIDKKIKLDKEEEERLEITERLRNQRQMSAAAAAHAALVEKNQERKPVLAPEPPKPKTEAELWEAAADDIENQIRAHQLSSSLDAEKPFGAGLTNDGTQISGRIIGANAHFVAINTGRQIEIFQIAELIQTMQYKDGKSELGNSKDFLTKGNMLEISFKNNMALATVTEKRPEMRKEVNQQASRTPGRERELTKARR